MDTLIFIAILLVIIIYNLGKVQLYRWRANKDHPVVLKNPTLKEFDEFARGLEMVYIHDMEDKPLYMVIPVQGWWASQMPKASEEHFEHDHIRIDGRFP